MFHSKGSVQVRAQIGVRRVFLLVLKGQFGVRIRGLASGLRV